MFMDWMIEYGLWSLALLMLLQNLVPLLPSEVIMPLAGFLASLGYLDLRGAILAGLLGSLAGHVPWYALGYKTGEKRLQIWAERYGRWFGLRSDHIRMANGWFARHTRRAVLIGRLIPGIRTCVNVPAGAARMPLLAFFGYTALGDAIWTGSLAWAGFSLGREYRVVSWYLHILLIPALILVTASAVWFLRRRSPADKTPPPARTVRRTDAFRRRPLRLRLPGVPKSA